MTRFDIPWEQGRAWHYDGDRLAHDSGGFFSLVGRRTHSNVPSVDGLSMPIIDQPEVGILGFAVREGSFGPDVLVQAKAEPGNIGLVQLAPTVQATVSNYTRVHGGGPTPYLDLFTCPQPGALVADSLQSEHGSRFLAKYNRNATVLVKGSGPTPESDSWRWWPVSDLLASLHDPFAVNTDARSALVASDWPTLGADEPFARHGDGGFGFELRRSYIAAGATDPKADLTRMREAVELELEHVRLDRLAGWRHDGWTLADEANQLFTVPMVRVEAPDREVVDWDQPLVRGIGRCSVGLVCQMRDGVLQFQLRGSVEPGFAEKVQFGPTSTGVVPHGAVVAACRQSDEGGRFDQTVVDYRIVMAPDSSQPPEDDFTTWMTLGDIAALVQIQGACTNELRSALSLLLYWR